MKSHFFSFIFVPLVATLLCHHHVVEGQANKVSPKLDFDDAEKQNNSSVSNAPGVVQARRDDGQNTDSNNAANDGRNTNTGSGGKSGPKIHGVRVTVDTGDTQKSKESKESVEITDVGKHKKRVGIHTDITFEITADGDEDANATSSMQRSDKEDASVPIYKGRGGSSHKSRKPHDPKTYWMPSFSAERRSYDSGSRTAPSYPYYPHYPHNVPVYGGSGDNRGNGGSVYRRGDGWTSYVPITSVWTTERTLSEPYRPNAVTGYRAPSWKPCYCLSASNDNRRRRDNTRGFAVLQPTSSVIKVVDGKLEQPFSKK